MNALAQITLTCTVCGTDTDAPEYIGGEPVCDDMLCQGLQDAKGYASKSRSQDYPLGQSKCPSCNGSGSGPSEWHYVRGHGIRNDCATCDGRGHTSKFSTKVTG